MPRESIVNPVREPTLVIFVAADGNLALSIVLVNCVASIDLFVNISLLEAVIRDSSIAR